MMRSLWRPLGDLRLLRDADRLERRHRARARAAVRRRARRAAPARATTRSSRRSSASSPARRIATCSRSTLARLAEREGIALAGRRARRARALAAVVGAVSRGARRARGRARPRLEARDPLEHRPRLLDASLAQIGVPFELSIVASEIGSYKPGASTLGGVRPSRRRAARDTHVHVGASLFHDIAPATELGLPTIWINRLGEQPEPQPDVELRSLSGLGARARLAGAA